MDVISTVILYHYYCKKQFLKRSESLNFIKKTVIKYDGLLKINTFKPYGLFPVKLMIFI